MAGKYEKKRKGDIIIPLILLMICIGAAGLFLSRMDPLREDSDSQATELPGIAPTAEIATETECQPTETEAPPTEPPSKVSVATIGATGDILLHDTVINSGYDEETGTYNYDNMFTWFQKYVSRVDYAVANLEVTLAGNENGRKYGGYPCFNSPDEIVDALKTAGFDMLLTANNHSYDTKTAGFMRTQQVIAQRELEHIGTRQKEDEKNYIVRDINGIRVGMTCYTYCNGFSNSGKPKLNGNVLPTDVSPLVNYFHYKRQDEFCEKLSGELSQMREEGAEAFVIFIHWGDEYKTSPNAYQKEIGQKLCDLGIDVIVGNHAHVVQPVELLTSRTDENHKTLCLYSTGNAVSNIHKSNTHPVHTEDGMLFSFTFAKYTDGTVLIEHAQVLPTWVWRYNDESGVKKFRVIAMDTDADWKTEMELEESLAVKCQESLDRTMEIVGEGLDAANTWFAQAQEEKEIALGIR